MLFPRLETGFNLIDNLWRGFFKGRTYLVTGPVNSGKTTFCLQFASKGLALKDRVIFFTDERTEDLLLRAEAIQFDISTSLEQGDILIFDIGHKQINVSDSLLHNTITEVLQIIEKEKPERLIFDQFTPLLQFEDLEALKHEISELVDSLEKFKVTTLIAIGEPASDQAVKILEFLGSVVTATLKLSAADLEEKRPITLNARLGHYPTAYSASFFITPKIGLTKVVVPPASPPPVGSNITPQAVESIEAQPTEKIEAPIIEKEPPPETVPTPSEELTMTPGHIETEPVEAISKETPISLDTKISDIPKSVVIEESIPEYPIRDLDRDDFTGFYNFDGLQKIITEAIEQKRVFSLVTAVITKGVDSRAKRLLLSQKLAGGVKKALGRPVPVGRYSDKIFVFLNKTTKTEIETMMETVKTKVLSILTAENDSLNDIDIRFDVYAYPEDIRTIREVEAIIQSGVE
jgi:KaiC/GvpD/RAD55 family RecA-like ATPase